VAAGRRRRGVGVAGEARRPAAFLGYALAAEKHEGEETQPLSGLGC
jgi:hypothetical protein